MQSRYDFLGAQKEIRIKKTQPEASQMKAEQEMKKGHKKIFQKWQKKKEEKLTYNRTSFREWRKEIKNERER